MCYGQAFGDAIRMTVRPQKRLCSICGRPIAARRVVWKWGWRDGGDVSFAKAHARCVALGREIAEDGCFQTDQVREYGKEEARSVGWRRLRASLRAGVDAALRR